MDEQNFEQSILGRLMELKEDIAKLVKRIERIERELSEIEIIGEFKRLHCKYNIGGVCRVWSWDDDPEISGLTCTKLKGRFHPEVTSSFCASCASFQKGA
jgi:hypothetical protein